jgi:DNA processing protein
MSTLSTEACTHWLAFLRAPGLSAAKRRAAFDVLGSIERVIGMTDVQARALKIPSDALNFWRKPDTALIESDLAWLAGGERCLLTLDAPHYPPLLAQASDAPVALFVMGDVARLSLPSIAIVGSRGASNQALEFAAQLGHAFSASGLTVVSGLAIGIDTAAHKGALVGPGTTVAVLANGLDAIYPKQNQELANKIFEQGGALVSEMPLGTQPLPALFPQRNRIISGLSLGVVVVEASVQSGSLVTARFAGEQGREVFAVPGSIHNPMARGCHQLIRQGAKLVESANDVLSDLQLQIRAEIHSGASAQTASAKRRSDSPTAKQKPPEAPAEYAELLQAMGFDAITLDRLVDITGASISKLSSALMALELDGHVEAQAGGRWLRLR